MEHPFLSQPDSKEDDAFVSSDPFAGQSKANREPSKSPKSARGTKDQLNDAPPPPYESVVMSQEDVPSIGGNLRQVNAAPSSDFHIVVTDPVKHGDGVGWRRMQAYVSYKLQTRTSLPQYKSKNNEVIRRFRDFAWLHTKLQEQNRGIIIPALPEKNAVQKYQMNADFIEQRRRALQVYINRVGAHPELQTSPVLQQFLEASEEDWSLEMSRSGGSILGRRPSSGPPMGRLDRTIQMFKELSHSTTSLVHGKHDEDDEDPEYLKVKEYILQLEALMTETRRQASRLIKRQEELGASLGEFGSSLMGLGKFEPGPLADQFMNIGEKSQSLAKQSQEQAEALLVSFDAPLKEFVRLVKSAKTVMNDRSSALQAVHQARTEVDAKRNKLQKLRGVAGIKEEKISEAERELNDAAHRVENATATYEEIVKKMSVDLARFQRERSNELSLVLRNFAVSQAQLAAETARIWRQHLGDTTNGTT